MSNSFCFYSLAAAVLTGSKTSQIVGAQAKAKAKAQDVVNQCAVEIAQVWSENSAN